jgi:hypothetical protein
MKPRDLLLTRRHSLALMLAWGSARAQGAYPSRSITLIVPFGPGGIADLTARAVAKEMSVSLRQPIVIDNRPSAGAIVGATAVAHSEPDGHTVLLLSNANAVSTGLFRKLPFDVQRDFAPVTTIGFFDLALFVAHDSPWRSVKDVIARAKAKPGRLTVGTISRAAATPGGGDVQVDVADRRGGRAVQGHAALKNGSFAVSIWHSRSSARCWRKSAAARCARWPSRRIVFLSACLPCQRCKSPACPAMWPSHGTPWPCPRARPLRWSSG